MITTNKPGLIQRYENTQSAIQDYATQYNRNPEDISLIAVSKRHSAENIMDLIKHGHRDFAENFLQEGEEKIAYVKNQLAQSQSPQETIVWHFIGHIQSRKCKSIATLFDWVHTVESLKVATKLNQHRQGHAPLNILIQLNLQKEESKSGISIAELENLAKDISTMENLKLRGLMIIPKEEKDFARQQQVFRQCRECFEKLNFNGYQLDHLSMGMTTDMEAAISQGATQIRIGTAIFGARPN